MGNQVVKPNGKLNAALEHGPMQDIDRRPTWPRHGHCSPTTKQDADCQTEKLESTTNIADRG
jgi:hypothetical protein